MVDVIKFCKYKVNLNQFHGKQVIKGDLDLYSVKELPDNFNPIVGGHLYLNSLTKLPNAFNTIVIGDLYLNSLIELPNNFNPIVGGDLCLYSITTLPNNFNPIVGGNLNIWSVNELPNEFNTIVSGDLYLNSIIELPNNFNPKCNKIRYNNRNSCKELNTSPKYIILNNYIKTDTIYKIIEQKGNRFKVQEFNSDKIFYIITDDINYGQSEYLVEALINLKNKY